MKKLQISIALMCFGLLAGCGGGSNNSAPGNPQAVLQTIQVTPAVTSIAAGLSQQFTATGKYSDNSTKDLTNSVVWSSSNTSTATVSNIGMASSKAQGSTTIMATYSNVSGDATLTVTAPALTQLTVSPASASLALGTGLQLTAIGTYTDGSTQNLTNSATWNSSNTSTASVSSNGMVTSNAQGPATIGATYAGVSGNASLARDLAGKYFHCAKHDRAIRGDRHLHRQQHAEPHRVRAMDIGESLGGNHQRQRRPGPRDGDGSWHLYHHRNFGKHFFQRDSYDHQCEFGIDRGNPRECVHTSGHVAAVHRYRHILGWHDTEHHGHGDVEFIEKQHSVDHGQRPGDGWKPRK